MVEVSLQLQSTVSVNLSDALGNGAQQSDEPISPRSSSGGSGTLDGRPWKPSGRHDLVVFWGGEAIFWVVWNGVG